MTYVYILEGPLKYETISLDDEDDEIGFIFYAEIKPKNYKMSDFLLKSDYDGSVTVRENKKITIKSENKIEILLVYDGGEIEKKVVSDELDIDFFGLNKLSIPLFSFSMLINTKEDINIDKKKVGNESFYLLLTILFFVVCILSISLIYFLPLSKTNIWYKDEFYLMKSDVSDFRENEFIVKSRLKKDIESFLNEKGLKFIHVKLHFSNHKSKASLEIDLFDDNNENLYKTLNFSKFKNWIDNVEFSISNYSDMYSDFNKIADKYNIEKIKKDQPLGFYMFEIEVSSNNLKFSSISDDINIFKKRWGSQYVDFNIVLVNEEVESFEFMIVNKEQNIVRRSNNQNNITLEKN